MRPIRPLLLASLLAAPLAAQDEGDDCEGRWYRMAIGADETPSAAAPADAPVDPDALFDLADRTEGIAAELAALRTDGGVRGRQQEVEEKLTALIGILEREGG